MLGHPNAVKTTVTPGLDALETFFLCVVLGFRGTYYDNVPGARVIHEMRNKLPMPPRGQPLRDLGVQTNVEPLEGHAVLRRVVGVYGGMTLVSVLLVLIISDSWDNETVNCSSMIKLISKPWLFLKSLVRLGVPDVRHRIPVAGGTPAGWADGRRCLRTRRHLVILAMINQAPG